MPARGERAVEPAAGLQERPCSGREPPCLGRGDAKLDASGVPGPAQGVLCTVTS